MPSKTGLSCSMSGRRKILQNLGGSANIPLLSLRLRVDEIPKDKQVIAVCADGIASEAAAYLLSKYGINTVALKDGMKIDESADTDDGDEGDEPESDFSVNFDGPVETIEPIELEVKGDSVPASPPEPIPEAVTASLSNPFEIVKNENTYLVQVNNDLKAKVSQLQTEKEELEQRNEVLAQQLARLKDILNRLTKSK
jgi:hypothetical protein